MDHRTKSGSPTDMLEHYGVKGMKWGERRAHRKDMRALDRTSRRKDRTERNKQIDAARGRLHSGALANDYKAAKTEYKAQRHIVGRREAAKVLRDKREKLDAEFELSKQAKHGAEATAVVVGTVGGIILASAAIKRYA